MPDLLGFAVLVALLVSILRLLGRTQWRRATDDRESSPGGTSVAGLSAEYARLDTVGKVREAIRLRDGISIEWTEYVQDIRSVYLRPLLEDVTVPASAHFWRCRERVEYLAPLAELLLTRKIGAAEREPVAARATEFLLAAVDLTTAWAAADEHARSVGVGLLDNRTKVALGKVRSLLNRATDERTGAGERENCRQRILQILGDLRITIPPTARERALGQLAPAQWRQLTASPPDFGQGDEEPDAE